MTLSLDAGTQWVDRGNTFAFLEVIGSKLNEITIFGERKNFPPLFPEQIPVDTQKLAQLNFMCF